MSIRIINGQKVQFDTRAYVTDDGSYTSRGVVMSFDHEALTEQQWTNLLDIGDDYRYDYVLAILQADEDRIAEIEEMYID